MRRKSIEETVLDYIYVVIFELGVLVSALIRLA